MLHPSTLKFLKSLKKNNNREWFASNREKYDLARADFENFIAELIKAISKKDKRIAGLTPKECVYRIYRDVRFSKNKAPYKSNFSASINSGGRKSGNAGLYIQIEPDGEWGSMFAGGHWMPEAPVLKAIRQEIQYHSNDFKKIISHKDFTKWFGGLEDQQLKKAPKGFDKNDPDIHLFKYTSYIVSHGLNEKELISKDLVKNGAAAYQAMLPLLDFLNKATA